VTSSPPSPAELSLLLFPEERVDEEPPLAMVFELPSGCNDSEPGDRGERGTEGTTGSPKAPLKDI
jgi:hypothetical protein